jgi:hypothetical protein
MPLLSPILIHGVCFPTTAARPGPISGSLGLSKDMLEHPQFFIRITPGTCFQQRRLHLAAEPRATIAPPSRATSLFEAASAHRWPPVLEQRDGALDTRDVKVLTTDNVNILYVNKQEKWFKYKNIHTSRV